MKQKIRKNRFLDGSKDSKKLGLQDTQDLKAKKIAKNNFLFARLKAFITDIFLINMPLLYFVTYVILGDKNSFQNNQIAIFLCGLTYCFILILFFYFSGQTPGFRYAEIMLERDFKDNKDSKKPKNIESENRKIAQKPTFLQCVIYVFFWLVEISFFLWIFSFMRKDKKSLHELLSKTKITHKPNIKR